MSAVYILTNRSMPGLCKVGYTDRSVNERISELNASTSIPTKFEVEYFVELEDGSAHRVEKRSHSILHKKGFHHGKEYFQCSVNDCKDAVAEAIASTGSTVLYAKDAEETRRRVLEAERKRAEEKLRYEAEQAREAVFVEKERQIRSSYDSRLENYANPGDFWKWWLGCGLLSVIAFPVILPKAKDGAIFFGSAFFSLVAAFFVREYWKNKKQQNPYYLKLEHQRDSELATVRGRAAPSLPPGLQPISRAVSTKKAAPNYTLAAWVICIAFICLVVWVIGESKRSSSPPITYTPPQTTEQVSSSSYDPEKGSTAPTDTKPREKDVSEKSHNSSVGTRSDSANDQSEQTTTQYITNNKLVLVNTLCNRGTGWFGGNECESYKPPLRDENSKKWVSDTKYYGDGGYECNFTAAHYYRAHHNRIYAPDEWKCFRTDGQKWNQPKK